MFEPFLVFTAPAIITQASVIDCWQLSQLLGLNRISGKLQILNHQGTNTDNSGPVVAAITLETKPNGGDDSGT